MHRFDGGTRIRSHRCDGKRSVAAGFTMCGRMVLTRSASEIAETFEAEVGADETATGPRFNVAPAQSILAIREDEEGSRELVEFEWGLVPFWVKERAGFRSSINARSETVATKPSFRAAFQRRRCLVPADGFYEWERRGKTKKTEQAGAPGPYFFSARDRSLLAMAGIWESWVDRASGEVVESCALLTVAANRFMGRIHHRMPALIEKADWGVWLAPGPGDPEPLLSLLQPAPEDRLDAVRVGRYVNQARNEGPRCLEPLAEVGDSAGC